VKIYVAAVEALRKKERQDETPFTTKLMVFWVSPPPWMLMYFFAGFFLESHPVYDQTQGSGVVFVLLTLWITLLSQYYLNGYYNPYHPKLWSNFQHSYIHIYIYM
jgi:hypothetical protein